PALLPRRVPGDPARRRPGPARGRRHPVEPRARRDRLRGRGGALGAAAVPARAPPAARGPALDRDRVGTPARVAAVDTAGAGGPPPPALPGGRRPVGGPAHVTL